MTRGRVRYRPDWRDVGFVVLVIAIAWTVWHGEVAQDAIFRKADESACQRIEEVKQTTRSWFAELMRALPTLAYYKAHPDELADQLALRRRQYERFGPARC